MKAVFAACIRDCEPWLASVLANAEMIASHYEDAAFIFVENDSKDQTPDVVRAWIKGRKNAKLISLDGLASDQPQRTIRLAIARQTYIEELKSNFLDHTHLVVFDGDEINAAALDANAVNRAIAFLEENESCGGVFANQAGFYYDLWALRHLSICPGDVWEEVCDYVMLNHVSDREAYDQTFSKRIFSLNPDSAPLEVESAFGGLAIYKIKSIIDSDPNFIGSKTKRIFSESGTSEVGWQVCEHVSFNAGIRKLGKKLVILPYLLNFNTTSSGSTFSPSAFRRLIFDLKTKSKSSHVGRNDPCPCGSGKKFKQCHGRR